jgi:hypothetical protein
MPDFKCSLCGYKSGLKNNVQRHIDKQTKCTDGIPEIIEIITQYNCEYCEKNMTTSRSLDRHLKTCKVKKSNIEKELNIEKEKVKELEKKLAVSEALAKKPLTINNNSTNNQTNININLAPWNNPALPDDVEKYYREAVKKIFLAVPTLIKYIHFNAEHPENHNICIKNARSKTAKVYNGKEWETIDEDILIRTLIDDYENTLEDYAEEKNPKYIKSMKVIKERDDEDKIYDDLHNEVKRVIYDRKHMVSIKK